MLSTLSIIFCLCSSPHMTLQVINDSGGIAPPKTVIEHPISVSINIHTSAFESIRSAFDFDQNYEYPLEIYYSPKSNDLKNSAVRNGVYTAASLWAPYIDNPSILTVHTVTPQDRKWYDNKLIEYKMWEWINIERQESWFDRSKDQGGGALFDANNHIYMFYMTPDIRTVYDLSFSLELYVHEMTHIFQFETTKHNIKNMGCFHMEGSATLIGLALSNSTDYLAYMRFLDQRRIKIEQLQDYYTNRSTLKQDIYEDIMGGYDGFCNTKHPYFGYNLAMFVAEHLIHTMGIEEYIEMHYMLDTHTIEYMFEQITEQDFEEWIENQVVPYVIETIS